MDLRVNSDDNIAIGLYTSFFETVEDIQSDVRFSQNMGIFDTL